MKNGKEKTRRRSRVMFLDWMMKEDYSKLKESAEQRDERRHSMREPA